jgi:hypothetical protein
MMNLNTKSLVASAISIFDPSARLQIDYEDQVASVTEVVESLREQDPQAAMELDPQTLSGLILRAQETQREIIDVLSDFVNERALAA